MIVGALNWGLVAIPDFDLVAEIFGEEFGTTNAVTRIIYGLVGFAGFTSRPPSSRRYCETTRVLLGVG